MDFDRLPSFLVSLCLHLGLVALVVWWPASRVVPEPPKGTLVDVYFTLGAPGKSVPEARQAIPEAARGRQDQPQQVTKPQEQAPPRTVAQVEKPVQQQKPPEIKPIEKPAEPKPEIPDAIPVPKEPEKPKEPDKPAEPEKPKEQEKPKDQEKPKEPDKPKEPEKTKPPEKVDIEKELKDLAKQTGTPTGSRSGSGSARGQGSAQSSGSLEKDLADLAKSLGGSGDDAAGTGPGGSGGDGVGVQGTYLQVIHSRVKANWSFPGFVDRRQFSTLMNIRIAPDGTIIQYRMLRSSGNPVYDSSVENALLKTRLEPPPRPDLADVDIDFAF